MSDRQELIDVHIATAKRYLDGSDEPRDEYGLIEDLMLDLESAQAEIQRLENYMHTDGLVWRLHTAEARCESLANKAEEIRRRYAMLRTEPPYETLKEFLIAAAALAQTEERMGE